MIKEFEESIIDKNVESIIKKRVRNNQVNFFKKLYFFSSQKMLHKFYFEFEICIQLISFLNFLHSNYFIIGIPTKKIVEKDSIQNFHAHFCF